MAASRGAGHVGVSAVCVTALQPGPSYALKYYFKSTVQLFSYLNKQNVTVDRDTNALLLCNSSD